MKVDKAKYQLGQLIHHKLFDYRGVIIDVDSGYNNTEEWYTLMAKNKPAKNQPWYHVLVDGTDYTTYVAEQNLEMDVMMLPITHPEVSKYFGKLDKGVYTSKRLAN